jgi:hypothetical protein
MSPQLTRSDVAGLPTIAMNNAPDKTKLRELCNLAARGLEPMFDVREGLFCQRFRRENGKMVREGLSYRYTIMTFLGLLEYERSGGKSPIPVNPAIRSFFEKNRPVDNIGDLGLLLWLSAKTAPEQMSAIYEGHNVEAALGRYRGAARGNTMELSWFLTGLSYAAMSPAKNAGKWQELANKTYEILSRNQGSYGFFGHISNRGTIEGIFRGSVGSFADQVYPIYAFSRFSTAFGHAAALSQAKECAAAICGAQGPLGQWWWHYDASTGQVVQRYPVYSVHQHAMGPMALIALMQAAQCDLTGPMFKGLDWIYGQNELQTATLDPAESLVWRAIRPASGFQRRAHQAKAYLRLADDSGQQPSNLKILFECWPYELGWLLYAFSNFER